MTRDTIVDWFSARGWSVEQAPAGLLVFRSGQDMPEGIWREARVTLASGFSTVGFYLVAFNGHRVRMHRTPDVPFADTLELDFAVATTGPKSFGHVIERFARNAGLTEGAA